MEQIMNQTDVKVSFYLKKSEADARGNYPVMARLIVGKHSETAFSVKFRVPQSLWSSGRACGKSVAARDINNRLDEIRAAALGIYAEQSAIREDVTAEDVKHQLLGMASEQETLLSYFRLFIRNFEKRVGINRTEKTLRAYRNSYNHLVRFLQMQYKLSDIPFAALDRSFIEKYDLYLRMECCLASGTIVNLTVFPDKGNVGFFADGDQPARFLPFLDEGVAVILPVSVHIDESVSDLRSLFRACPLYQFHIIVGHIHVLLCQPVFVIVQYIQWLECFHRVLLLRFL